ncbi:hypothetical protein OGAPHI_002417 [Ogataea philodendri]|uniref:Uncharacterized protein n=1 Tax=Ogataea philodendri TaxID=1378263 RepID=A0A9P8PAH0_9ASCO|nr:uncharacterized protein OGAPHI_002417 [Ogataea philodendri]KAH3668663.1 hypothetical protein OGAPHI_002417 [Ogataea philodendri]
MNHSHTDTVGQTSGHSFKKKHRSARACLVCRERKVKCDVTVTYPDKCSNCVHFDIDCVLPEPKKRVVPKVNKIKAETHKRSTDGKHETPDFVSRDPHEEFPELYTRSLDPGKMLRREVSVSSTVEYFGPPSFLQNAVKEYIDTKRKANQVKLFHLNEVDFKYLDNLGCFCLPDQDLFELYINTYFETLHVQFPILNKYEFLRDYLTLENPKSLLLLQSVLFAGAKMYRKLDWSSEDYDRQQRITNLLNRRATALFELHVEQEPILLLQSMFIFGNYWDWDTQLMNTKNVIFLTNTKMAISMAYSIGLHRNFASNKDLSSVEKNIYKRIWWCLFLKDTFSSFALSRPFSIDLQSCEVPWPDRDTLDDTAHPNDDEFGLTDLEKDYFLQRLSLARVLRKIVDNQNVISRISHSGESTYSLLKESDQLLADWMSQLPTCFHLNLEDLNSILNSYGAWLNLEYHTILLFVHRCNIIGSTKIATERNGRIPDVLPSWSASFKVAYVVTQFGDYLKREKLLRNTTSLILYSMWTAGITMVYHLHNKDPQIVEIARRSIVTCIDLLSDWPMADFMSYTMKTFLEDRSKQLMVVRGTLKMVNSAVASDRQSLRTSEILDELLKNYTNRLKNTSICKHLMEADQIATKEEKKTPAMEELNGPLLPEYSTHTPPMMFNPAFSDLVGENWMPTFDISPQTESSDSAIPFDYAMTNVVDDLFGVLRPALRFNSTAQKPNDQKSKTDGESKDESKKKSSFNEIWELLKLTRTELSNMSIAILFLGISSSVSMLFPMIMGKVIDMAKEEGEKSTINIFSREIPARQFFIGVGGLFLVGSLANFGRIILLRKVGERIMAQLRVDILRKIFYQDAKFWDIHKSGDLISRLVNDSTVVARSVTQNVSDGLRSSISCFVGIGMMVTISVKLTGYMALIFPVLMFFALVFGRRIKSLSKEIQKQLGNLTKVSEEQFNFTKTIQSFNNEEYEVGKFKKEVTKLYDLSVHEGRLSGYFFAGNGFVGNVFLIGLLSVGVQMVRQGELTLGELSSYMLYTTFSASSVYSLSNFYTELMKGVGASERIFDLIKLEPAIVPTKGKKIDVLGNVEFKNVSFKYPTRPTHQVFNNLELKINKGDHVCLVGPSGCGKSTVAQLLLRYYEPESGQIIVDGEPLTEVSLANFREQTGIVQQEPMLFSGTLRENITYGKMDATDEEIQKVCDLANCSKFINNFPDKLDTVIGSKGAQLSGGQKQRIALARTLLLGHKTKDTVNVPHAYSERGELLLGPSILILDEATSALDAKSEEAIKRTLRLRQKAGLTTISIAHRLSTIKTSDRIVVFNNRGQVVEYDNFDKLYADPESQLNKLLSKSETGQETEHKEKVEE